MANPKFVIRRTRKSRQWYAVWIAKNGKTVWKTSETYTRKASLLRAIDTFFEHGDFSDVEDKE